MPMLLVRTNTRCTYGQSSMQLALRSQGTRSLNAPVVSERMEYSLLEVSLLAP